MLLAQTTALKISDFSHNFTNISNQQISNLMVEISPYHNCRLIAAD
jgi:hypothetical protein